MRPLYIFDLDGTLALIGHCRPLVTGETKDWPAFFAACVDDEPNWPVINVLRTLRTAGAEIWIWSGRSDEVRALTLEWLRRFRIRDGRTTRWDFNQPTSFRMRAAGDHQPDEKLKATWLSEMDPYDRRRLVGIFEDRDRMVKLWRDNGICCFQVAPGDF